MRLGDTYADFGNRIKRHNNIARSVEQGEALEEELRRLRKTAKEQPDLLKQDFL